MQTLSIEKFKFLNRFYSFQCGLFYEDSFDDNLLIPARICPENDKIWTLGDTRNLINSNTYIYS